MFKRLKQSRQSLPQASNKSRLYILVLQLDTVQDQYNLSLSAVFLECIRADIVIQRLQALLTQQKSKHLEEGIVLSYTYISKDTVLKQLIRPLRQTLELRMRQIAQPSYNYIKSQRETLEQYQILSYTLPGASISKGILCLLRWKLICLQVRPNTYNLVVVSHFVLLYVQISLGFRVPSISQATEYSLLGLKASVELLLRGITNKHKYKYIYYLLSPISQLNLNTSVEYYKNRANGFDNCQEIATIQTESKQDNISSTVPILILQRSIEQVAAY